MRLEQDLHILDEQEQRLRFQAFDAETAWVLGSKLRVAAVDKGAGCTIEIEVAGQLLFACATPGANPGQANWIRRKRNTVHHLRVPLMRWGGSWSAMAERWKAGMLWLKRILRRMAAAFRSCWWARDRWVA